MLNYAPLEIASANLLHKNVLRAVLAAWCEERRLPLNHEQAEAAAYELHGLLEMGIDSPGALLDLIRTM
jgi:hypothetical protein